MRAAIVGGGVEAVGTKITVISGIARQALLAAFALLLFCVGYVHEYGPPDAFGGRKEGASAREASPNVANINGLWLDANGARWLVKQDGTRFSYDYAGGSEPSSNGEGEIEGRRMLVTHRAGGMEFTCQLELSANEKFITGTCQKTDGGNEINGVRWHR